MKIEKEGFDLLYVSEIIRLMSDFDVLKEENVYLEAKVELLLHFLAKQKNLDFEFLNKEREKREGVGFDIEYEGKEGIMKRLVDEDVLVEYINSIEEREYTVDEFMTILQKELNFSPSSSFFFTIRFVDKVKGLVDVRRLVKEEVVEKESVKEEVEVVGENSKIEEIKEELGDDGKKEEEEKKGEEMKREEKKGGEEMKGGEYEKESDGEEDEKESDHEEDEKEIEDEKEEMKVPNSPSRNSITSLNSFDPLSEEEAEEMLGEMRSFFEGEEGSGLVGRVREGVEEEKGVDELYEILTDPSLMAFADKGEEGSKWPSYDEVDRLVVYLDEEGIVGEVEELKKKLFPQSNVKKKWGALKSTLKLGFGNR